jgi:hypothetical protein
VSLPAVAGRSLFTEERRTLLGLLELQGAWLAHWKHSVSPVFLTPQMSRPPSPPSWSY